MEQSTQTIQEFYKMVGEFKILEALDQYYEEEVISWENDGEVIQGLSKLREFKAQFVQRAKDPKLTLKHSVMLNGFSLAQWHYQFEDEDRGAQDYYQISIGYWKDGKIIKEHHLY